MVKLICLLFAIWGVTTTLCAQTTPRQMAEEYLALTMEQITPAGLIDQAAERTFERIEASGIDLLPDEMEQITLSYAGEMQRIIDAQLAELEDIFATQFSQQQIDQLYQALSDHETRDLLRDMIMVETQLDSSVRDRFAEEFSAIDASIREKF